MSQYVSTAEKGFEAGAEIGANLRVTLVAGVLQLAGLAVKELGTLFMPATVVGEMRPVRLRTAQGTSIMVANGAISEGDTVYTAADGKVGPSATGAFQVGQALEAATADGDWIEVLRNSHGDTAAT